MDIDHIACIKKSNQQRNRTHTHLILFFFMVLSKSILKYLLNKRDIFFYFRIFCFKLIHLMQAKNFYLILKNQSNIELLLLTWYHLILLLDLYQELKYIFLLLICTDELISTSKTMASLPTLQSGNANSERNSNQIP